MDPQRIILFGSVSRGEAGPWSDLGESHLHDAVFEALRMRANGLDQYYTEARYPSGLPEEIPVEFFDCHDAMDALTRAQAVVDFVTAKTEEPEAP